MSIDLGTARSTGPTATAHECVACREIVSPDGSSLRFAARYQGPPGNVNGGVVIGALTCVARRSSPLDDPAVTAVHARLHRGIPQSTDLAVTAGPGTDGAVDLTLAHDGAVLVTASVALAPTAALRMGRPSRRLSPDRVLALAELAEPGAAQLQFSRANPRRRPVPQPNPFGRCFVCGVENPEGLRVRAEPVGLGLGWASNHWASGFVEADGRLDTVIAVASLDCPSVPCIDPLDVLGPDEDVLLGSFDAEFLTVPPAHVPGGYRLPSRYVGRDGRKVFTDIALVGADATVYAVATATWVSVPRARFEPVAAG